jgi:hypothetical protein
VALKRTKLDKVISNLVRERSQWTCERCQKYYPEGSRGGLECSHYYGRRGLSTRWHPDNLTAFCTGCHFHMGGARDEYTAFLRKALGDTRFDELVLRGNKPRKYTPQEREEMYVHYKAQLEYLERRRRDGETGVIEFTSWD